METLGFHSKAVGQKQTYFHASASYILKESERYKKNLVLFLISPLLVIYDCRFFITPGSSSAFCGQPHLPLSLSSHTLKAADFHFSTDVSKIQ